MSARHANTTARFRPAGWVVFAAVVIVLVLVGSYLVRHIADSGPSDAAGTQQPTNNRTSSSPSTSVSPATAPVLAADHPATTPGATPCTQVNVVTSLENEDMVNALANAYTAHPRDIDAHCVHVAVSGELSGDAESQASSGFRSVAAGSRPTVWLPDSDAWLGMLHDGSGTGRTLVPARAESIGQSAIVVAMPKELAAAIGWNEKAPTWAQVFATAADPNVWTSRGHAAWGAFKLGKTSPDTASSGLLALAASYLASSKDASGMTVADVDSSTVQAQVTRNELATSHYMQTPGHFLFHAREAEQDGSLASFLSAMIVDENTLWDYNRGVSVADPMMSMGEPMQSGTPPKEKLVAIYPREGVFVADNPAAVLDASWVSKIQHDAATDFVRYARTAEGQQVVRRNGYRDIDGADDSSVTAAGSLAARVRPIATPSGAVLTAVQQSFPTVRKRARVLFLLDISGSMQSSIAPGLTKLKAAEHAVADALHYFGPNDDVGLAAFSNVRGAAITPGLVAPVAPLSRNRSAFLTALGRLHTEAETPLYEALDRYSAQLARGATSDRINAVIVLSDGRNDTTRKETRAQLIAALKRLHERPAPVLVFTLGYGHDADRTTLRAISTATGGHFYDASDPLTVDMLLSDLVTSF